MTQASVILLVVLAIPVVVILLLAATALMHRRYAAESDRRTCKHCQAVWPAMSKFCGKCGRGL
jgi:predicted amidophosphoribosyltransferase